MKFAANPFIALIIVLTFCVTACKKESADPAPQPGTDSVVTQPPTTPADPGTKPDLGTVETAPPVQTAVNTTVNGNCGGYFKALPAGYDGTTKKYPLLIFLHGMGELGNGTSDLPKVLNNAVPKLLKNKQFPANFAVGGQNFSFIVISPQFKAWPKVEDIDAVRKHVVANFRVDESRVYVTGLSMGGGMTWEYGSWVTDKIAAIVPICGASWPEKTRSNIMAKGNLPVWAFHNEDDGTVPVSYSRDYVNQMNSYVPAPTPKAKLTTWPSGGHDSWSKATNPATKIDGLNIYEWMLQYKR